MRRLAKLLLMVDQTPELAAFAIPAVAELRRVYDLNAERFDSLVGDDTFTFSNLVWRNGWYALERLAEEVDGWSSSRPANSLALCGAGVRLHVYRCGHDETVDLDTFRVDEAASETKRQIAAINADQLCLEFEPATAPSAEAGPEPSDLRELVIVHAGNPDDGCCGVWIGAPVPSDEVTRSPWHWLETLWVIDRPTPSDVEQAPAVRPRHDELPEPDVAVEPIERPAIESRPT